jgi:hypothetical protein
MRPLAALLPATAALAAAGLAAAADAQVTNQEDSVMEVIVYGNDPCPRSTDAEIVVCSRRPETERYRIPENYRPSGTRQQRNAWVNRARQLETVSDRGTYSCSAVGPGGHTGCLEELIRRNTGEVNEEADASAPPQ